MKGEPCIYYSDHEAEIRDAPLSLSSLAGMARTMCACTPTCTPVDPTPVDYIARVTPELRADLLNQAISKVATPENNLLAESVSLRKSLNSALQDGLIRAETKLSQQQAKKKATHVSSQR